MHTLTRREFIAGSMVLAGSLSLGGCAKSADSPKDKNAQGQVNYDIAIVGAGLAGLAAARAAAEQGARVALIEAGPSVGSLIRASPGKLAIAQIEENKNDWVFTSEKTDTIDDFLSRWKQMTEVGKRDLNYPDYDRVQKIMTESCKTISWIEEMKLAFMEASTKETGGVDLVMPEQDTDPSVLGGVQIAEAFQAALDSLGVDTMLSTRATDLIVEDGIVVGVNVKKNNKATELRASNVVLATGGYGASDEYRAKFIPEVDEVGCQYLGGGLNQGDGMTMASACDAALYEDGWIIPFYIMPSKKLTELNKDFAQMNVFGIEGGSPAVRMMVDASGKRFVDESAGSTVLATTMVDMKAGPYYVLFDTANSDIVSIIESGCDSGDVFVADTIEELQTVAGMQNLTVSFGRYMQAVESQTDEEFGKPTKNLTPYATTGPFYLVRYVPSYVATMGGVKTNANCQAIRKDETVIEGLYVVGEATHRFMYNRSFIPCASNSAGLTMGRMTGETLGAQVGKQA